MLALQSCDLTPQQEKQWSDTRVALLWHCPAFTHILYTMMNKSGHKYVALFIKDKNICPIAATDGSNLILNPDEFFKFNLNMRVFIVVHEILHNVFNHCGMMHQFRMRGKIGYPDGKTLDYNQEVYNMAADLVINDLIIESKIGEMPALNGQVMGLHDKNMATGKDSALDAYRKLYKQQQGGGGGCKTGFDVHLNPGTGDGKDPTQANSERNETEWQTQVAAALNAAKAQGKLPGALEAAFQEILEPKVDWREKIEGLFARKVGSGSWNWRRPDRRLIVRDIYAPGRSGFGANCVVIGVDTSGSVGQRELDMFFAEMAGILEDVKPKRLVVMWCDAQVHRVDEAEDPSDLHTIRAKGAPGRGGTSFIPVFEEIKKLGLDPDALVYLTDGMGSFPDREPSYPVIWGNIYPQSTYPWGDVVDIPQQAA